MSPKIRDFEHYTEGLPTAITNAFISAVESVLPNVLTIGLWALSWQLGAWAGKGFPVVGL